MSSVHVTREVLLPQTNRLMWRPTLILDMAPVIIKLGGRVGLLLSYSSTVAPCEPLIKPAMLPARSTNPKLFGAYSLVSRSKTSLTPRPPLRK